MRLDKKNRHERTREGIKYCEQCGRVLNTLYKEDICPECQEINLFAEVKEYIRSNDVREADVAEHFNIPIRKVRDWSRGAYPVLGQWGYNGKYCLLPDMWKTYRFWKCMF